MFKGGYVGKILRVNLTNKTYKVESLSERLAREYVGGAGFGIKYLYDEVPAGVDALAPDNKLIFATGPMSGTDAPCASRMALATKSPLTGAVGLALAGGYFPVELKFTGYDVLIIEGKSENPVYLWIKDGNVSFRSAESLWGTNTLYCQQIIKDDLKDQNIRIACIGPAGERQSKMAAIINERRAFGRKGVGAVMGSKNLKAICIRGNNEVPVASKEALKVANTTMLKAIKDSPAVYPPKNYTATGEWDTNEVKKIGKESCYKCPVGCSKRQLVSEGPYAGTLSVSEYESLHSFGRHIGADNLDSIIHAHRLCDEYGLDSMSVGVTIGFAMKLYDQGVLTKEDTDGVELNFGNHQAMIELIRKIAFRQGFGDLLADGSKAAAAKISKCSADHNRGYASQDIFGEPVPKPVDRFEPMGKGRVTKWNQDHKAVCADSATLCKFILDSFLPAGAAQNTADMVNAATGFDFTAEEILKVGERITNLARAFNVREGFERKNNTFPERILIEPIKAGASKGQYIPKEQLKIMLDEYCSERGWNSNGIPAKGKLIELGLENVIEDFEKLGLFL